MDKLKLEHIAVYLPYGLKVLFSQNAYYGGHCKDSYQDKIGYFAYNKQRIGSITGFKNGKVLSTIGFFDINKTDDTHVGPHITHKYQKRLILRPLSDLTKEIDINGEKFIPINKFNRESRQQLEKELSITNANLICDFLNYEIIKKLLQWHFDIHGLIEKGLAIDINTLKK